MSEVEIEVPRDRDGSFEPKIVKKRQRRLAGVDELVISLAAKGLTIGEIAAHRQRTSPLDHPLEGSTERIRDHLPRTNRPQHQLTWQTRYTEKRTDPKTAASTTCPRIAVTPRRTKCR